MDYLLTCRAAFACICLVLFLAGRPLAAAEKLLFDFKDGAALKASSQFLPDNLKVPAPRSRRSRSNFPARTPPRASGA